MNMNDDKKEIVVAGLRKTLASLDERRRAMEVEADATLLELTTPPDDEEGGGGGGGGGGGAPMGVDTPLVDADGYPRSDIDIYRARALRHRFATLKTDHKAIVEEIEGLLIQLAKLKNPSQQEEENKEFSLRSAPKPKPKFDSLTGKWVVMNWDGTTAGVEGGDQIAFEDLSRNISDVTTTTTADPNSLRTNMSLDESLQAAGGGASPLQQQHHHHHSQQQQQGSTSPRPETIREVDEEPRNDPSLSQKAFARVNAVAADSPAELAGLKEDDLIVQFGYANADNHQNLKAIAVLVPQVAEELGEIAIRILRRRRLQSMQEGGENNDSVDDDDGDEPELKTISLKPRPWAGRGMIGCHIVPYSHS